MGSEFLALGLTPVLISTFAGMACALPGNFLVLRKQALTVMRSAMVLQGLLLHIC